MAETKPGASKSSVGTTPKTSQSSKPNWDRSNFSGSVNQALDDVYKNINVAKLLTILKALYKLHNEYAVSDEKQSGFLKLIQFLEENFNKRDLKSHTPEQWTFLVLSIVTIPKTPGVINGRVFLAALILSEFGSIRQLTEDKTEWVASCRTLVGLLAAELLASPEKIDVRQLLTETGKKRWSQLFRISSGNLYETANLTDRPATKDLLSRDALAKYLANRLRYIYQHELGQKYGGSFFMHIDGSWGSGKSTLLGFLRNHLEQNISSPASKKELSRKGWVVIDFNAWQNQRLDPPWWFLMKGVYRQSMKELWKKRSWLIWLRTGWNEWAWRINTGTNYFIASLATFVLFLISLRYEGNSEKDWKAWPIIQVLTFIGFLWTQTKFLRTSLVGGSAKAAQKFIEESGKDPLNTLALHFKRQIKRIGHPVAIFIDDLDRCNKDYGIKLLEGLQTIFRDAKVVYVIAADRRWLSTMYENQYTIFAPVISSPAKPFGLVFLDKTFQLIVGLPNISSLQKQAYWNYLLNIDPDKNPGDSVQARANARDRLATAIDNTDRLNTMDGVGGGRLERQIMKEEIIGSISIGEEERYLEHKLQKFLKAIEPNPRAMKRIINDVSTAKAVSFLYDQDVEEDQLILWTILRLQYPDLAEYFWKVPERLSLIGDEDARKNGITGNPIYDELLREKETRDLFIYQSDDMTVKIDPEFLGRMKLERGSPKK